MGMQWKVKQLSGTAALCVSVSLWAACGSALDPNQIGATGSGGGGSQVQPGSTVTNADGVLTTVGPDGTLPGGSDPGGTLPDDGSVPTGDVLPGDVTGPDAPGASGAPDAPGASGGPAPSDGPASGQPTAEPTKGAPSTSADACVGFKNGTGITDDKIVIGNASDISGPVPGLFQSSQDALKAYVAYFNATSDICGRKLELRTYDTRTDAGADQQAYAAGCNEVFAMVGSLSAFDSGGAATAQGCGLPDLRTSVLTEARANCSTCYGAQSTNALEYENAVPDYTLKYYPEAAQKAAYLYSDAGAAQETTKTQTALMERRGMKFIYVAGIPSAEFNYTPYVQKMKDLGVQYVQYNGAYQQSLTLLRAMESAGFKPQIYLDTPLAYEPDYIKQGGTSVDGVTVYINFLPIEKASTNATFSTYISYLRQSNPSAYPNYFGVFAWSAAELFTKLATELGGDLNRASLVAAMSKVRKWDAGGMHEVQDVGGRHPASCWRFLTLKSGQWVDGRNGSKPICSGVARY